MMFFTYNIYTPSKGTTPYILIHMIGLDKDKRRKAVEHDDEDISFEFY